MDRQSEVLAAEGSTWAKPVVLLPVFALISAYAGTLSSFSLPANMLVLGTGGVLSWSGLRRPGAAPPPTVLPRPAVVWVIPFGLLLGVEAANFLLGSTDGHPTLSRLADPMLEHYLPRAGLFFGWMTALWRLGRL